MRGNYLCTAVVHRERHRAALFVRSLTHGFDQNGVKFSRSCYYYSVGNSWSYARSDFSSQGAGPTPPHEYCCSFEVPRELQAALVSTLPRATSDYFCNFVREVEVI